MQKKTEEQYWYKKLKSELDYQYFIIKDSKENQKEKELIKNNL